MVDPVHSIRIVKGGETYLNRLKKHLFDWIIAGSRHYRVFKNML